MQFPKWKRNPLKTNIAPGGPMPGYKRRKFFFRKSPQGKYIFSYFLIAGIVSTIFTLLFVYFSANTISISYDNNTLQMGTTPSVLIDRLLGIHGILVFVFGFLIIYFATRFTHRFIGPIYKIETTLDRMTEGDINMQISLRKKDDCKELADKLNRFNLFLYKELKEIESVGKSLEALASESFPEHTELTELSGRLNEILSRFNLTGDLPDDLK